MAGVIILKRLFTVVAYGLIMFYLMTSLFVFADEVYEGIPCISVSDSVETIAKVPLIGATSAIVIDAKTGRILYEKDAFSRRSIASTTKIMTAILALENGKLDDTVVISKRAAGVWGSTIYLVEGEKLTLKELLYGLMLNSGNDAAIAIAEHISGSVEEFIEMMNKKAIELGAKDTNYKSPHGLDFSDQYSTAYDLALITKYALKNSTFKEIVSTKTTTISRRNLYNTNEMLGLYLGADGVKTGYTGQAGRCLVTSVTRGNMRIISVVLNCGNRTIRAQSSKDILDYAFKNYKSCVLLEKGEEISRLPVIKGVRKDVPVIAVKGVEYLLTDDESNSIKTQILLPKHINAPTKEGTEIGSIKFLLNEKVIDKSPLKTGESVAHKSFMDYMREILDEWVGAVRGA